MVNAVFVGLMFLCSAAPAGLPGAELYLAGREAERAGRSSQAIEAYSASAAIDPALAPYARINAARCLSASGNRPAAIEALRNLLAEAPEGPWVLPAELNLAGMLALDADYSAASAIYAKALDFTPKTWVMERYDWAAAETYIKDPQFQARGYEYLRRRVATTVLRQRRVDGSRYLERSPSIEDRLAALLGLIKSAESTDSWKLALRLLPECAPPGRHIDVKTLEPMLTTNKRAVTDEQRQAFYSTVRANADLEWMRLFLTHLARSHTSIGEPATARIACDLLLELYGDSDEAGEALFWLANRLARNDRNKEAIDQYVRLANECSTHARADGALLTAAGLQKQIGDTAGFTRSLEQLVENHPRSRHAANAWYWLGNHHEAAGRTDEAAAAFRRAAATGVGDYYAHCAAQRLVKYGESPANGRNLRVDGTGSFMAPMRVAAQPYSAIADHVWNDPHFARLKFFGLNGFEEGEWEAIYMRKRLTGEPGDAVIYYAMCEAGLAKAAMDLAQANNWGVENGVRNPARLRIDYPLAYWTKLREKSANRGVDPYLVLAIAREESTFRPALTSHAGASGIMQVMPPTAKWLAEVDAAITAACAANLENPDNSFRLGIRYILRMMDRSGNNLVHALASYNAGPGNHSRWLRRWPNIDLETFVENIPFSETRNYVKTVLGAYAAYHSLYEPVQ